MPSCLLHSGLAELRSCFAGLHRYANAAKGYPGPTSPCVPDHGVMPGAANGIQYQWTNYPPHLSQCVALPMSDLLSNILTAPTLNAVAAQAVCDSTHRCSCIGSSDAC